MLTGPESSGKSTLAGALHEALPGSLLVPEFARFYLEYLGRPYTREDLERIGRGQQQWEYWFYHQQPAFLICDTDWTVLQVWEEYRYGSIPNKAWHWEKGFANARLADLYLLCSPDIPWEPDPLREHPEERHLLFQKYTALLDERKATYRIISGTHCARLAKALKEVHYFNRTS